MRGGQGYRSAFKALERIQGTRETTYQKQGSSQTAEHSEEHPKTQTDQNQVSQRKDPFEGVTFLN